MKKILNAKQMKNADVYTSESLKVPSLVLMERAALAVKDFVVENFSKDKKIAVACGTGNNGGDGMAIVRLLIQEGYEVRWLLVGDVSKLSESAKHQFDILNAYEYTEVSSILELSDCDVLVDAIFGTGLSRELEKDVQKTLTLINSFNCKRIAVDIPSGINATNGDLMGEAVKCDYTITFAYELLGHHLFRGRDYCGKIICAPIGITKESLPKEDTFVSAYEVEDLPALLPKRTSDSHKGTYGRVLVIAGQKDMAGAAYLAAKACYLAGAGLVKIYSEEENREILQQLLPEAMLTSYRARTGFSKTQLKKDLAWATTVLIGPALGTDKKKAELLEFVFDNFTQPIVCDADALTILSRDMQLFDKIKSPCIITPHIGEMGQLLHEQVFDVLSDMLHIAVNFSVKHDIITVLKSASTVIGTPKGDAYLNIYGNNGMSTGGSGDVLSGLIAGLLAQKSDLEEAAILGVAIHALAGDEARDTKGAYSMKSEDILTGITEVMKKLEQLVN